MNLPNGASLTASSIERVMACPSASLLPRAENASEWADAGHDDHEMLCRWVTTRVDEDLADIVQADLLARLGSLVPVGARAEVKLALDVATRVARTIGESSGRDYGKMAPFEIPGSADVIGEEGDAVVVIDWKTGYGDVEPASRNKQLWFYALAAMRIWKKERAIIRIIYTKMGRVDEHVIDDERDLLEYVSDLHRLVLRVVAAPSGAQPAAREGSWCKYCGSKPYCAAKVGLLMQIATKGAAIIGEAEMTPERASVAAREVLAMEQMVKDAKARMGAWADVAGPIDLGDGRMFGRYHRKGNEKLTGDVVAQAIREVLPEQAKDFEAMAIEKKATKAAIKRAAQALVQVGASKVEAAILKRTRELGGAKNDDTYPIGEYAADKHTAAKLDALDVDAVNRLLAEAV